jgi:HK97 gp10 family phage protein
MVKIRGKQEAVEQIRNLAGPEMVRQVGAALFAAGQEIQVEAQLSITNGAVSGKNHVPSRPGEPPKNDSGVLANNIETTQEGPLKVVVSSNAPYARHLEFGTSKMAERPYMRPAARKKRQEVVQLVRAAIRKVTSGGNVVP